MNSSFTLCIRKNPDQIKTSILIIEIRSSEGVSRVNRYMPDLSAHLQSRLHEALLNPPENPIILYPEGENIDEIHCFFPKKQSSLMDARCEFLRKQEKSLYFIPDGEE